MVDISKFQEPFSRYQKAIYSVTKFSEPFAQYQKAIDSMTKFPDPFSQYQKAIDSMTKLSDPFVQYQKTIDSMAKFSDPLAQYQKTIDSMTKLSDPFVQYQKTIDSMAKFSGPLAQYQKTIDSMAKFSDPLAQYQKTIDSMAKFSDPLAQYQKAIDAMAKSSDPMAKYQKPIDAISKVSDRMTQHQKIAASFNADNFKQLEAVALDVNDEIYIDATGNISLSSAQIFAAELQNISNEIVSSVTDRESKSVEDAVNNLITEIQRQKDPLLQKMLMWFLYPLIVGLVIAFINPSIDQFVRSNISQTKKEIAKELRLNVKSATQRPELLKAMKYVSADSLNVRVDASIKSDLVGSLKFSSVVLIVEKRKNWSLVQWSSPDAGVSINGWVFSRYLQSFK
jgi:hypothetical protein